MDEQDEGSEAPTTAALRTDRYGFFVGGGDQRPRALSVGTLRKRELKWLQMLDNWPLFMNKKFEKVRSRCRKGIPAALRGRAWKYLSGAAFHMDNPSSKNIFDQLDRHAGDARWNDDIEKDLFRQFPDHELFSRHGLYGPLGRDDLYRLLKCYTVLHPDEGYCQGQAPVAATLLMHMPLKDAFYCFVQICHKYLPGYYSPGLEAVQLDGDILFELLKRRSYTCYKHLKKYGVEPVLYMVEWFMCVFCRTLPWATVLRVWDMFFCEGVKVLFKVAIVLLRGALGSRELTQPCQDMYATVERLRRLPPDVMSEDALVDKVVELKLTEEDLEKVHYRQLKRRLKDKAAAAAANASAVNNS